MRFACYEGNSGNCVFRHEESGHRPTCDNVFNHQLAENQTTACARMVGIVFLDLIKSPIGGTASVLKRRRRESKRNIFPT